MTKRKLGGPASARNKQKKIREETSTQSSQASENKDKKEEEVKETPPLPAIKIKEEVEDVVEVEENTNTSDIIGKLLEDDDMQMMTFIKEKRSCAMG